MWPSQVKTPKPQAMIVILNNHEFLLFCLNPPGQDGVLLLYDVIKF